MPQNITPLCSSYVYTCRGLRKANFDWVNAIYLGVYAQVEQIGKVSLAGHFRSDDGGLFRDYLLQAVCGA